MENPFSIAFGKAPTQIVSRSEELSIIRENFDMENPSSDAFIITGPRGCGKTVALSSLLDEYRQRKDWIVVRLNIIDHMLEELASLIYEEGRIKKLFLRSEFSISFQGITFSVSGDNPVSSVSSFLIHVLKHYKKKGIKVLIGIDDIVKNSETVQFIRAFQGFIIDHYDVRLVVTGLHQNISSLQEEKSLTFLFRAPKIFLDPLPLTSIARSYASIFSLEETSASALAKATLGYAFAYQVLGSILFRDGKKQIDKTVNREMDELLQNRSYEIIWSECSEREREILFLIANGKSKNQEIQDALKISKGYLATYKDRLKKAGLIDVSARGKSSFALPRFQQFVLLKQSLL